jgi:protein-tyrosine phosphatase|tara:strand:- start:1428 stop:2222 length:795 start_codon:yes stop_codon:yes gene_type:complete
VPKTTASGTIADERLIDVPGSLNFRDFGGYEARSGARVRRGLLFRCGHLAALTREGQRRFAELDIAVVCDLRRPDERHEEPSTLPSPETRQILIPMDPGSAITMREIATRGVDAVAHEAYMREINRELASLHASDYARMMCALIEFSGQGFLVHCSAGKDRTGVAAAIILLTLGVSREQVMEDYLFSNAALDFEIHLLPKLRARYADDRIDVEGARTLSGVRAEFLQTALDEMERTYGSFDAYLERALGVSPAQRASLEAVYLE